MNTHTFIIRLLWFISDLSYEIVNYPYDIDIEMSDPEGYLVQPLGKRSVGKRTYVTDQDGIHT